MSRLPTVACLALGCTLLPACTASAPELQFVVRPYSEIRHAAEAPLDRYELARRYQAAGKMDLAVDAYMQAIKDGRRALEARNALAVLYAQQGRYADAVVMLKDASSQTPTAYLHNNLGYIYYLQGNHVDAIKEFRSALKLDPHHQWARNNLRLAATALDRLSKQRTERSSDSAKSTVPAIEVWGKVRGREEETARTVVASWEAAPQGAELTTPENAPRTVGAQVVKPLTPMANNNGDHPRSAVAVERVQFVGAVRTPGSEILVGTTKNPRLEVSNGNGVTGFAKRIKEILTRQGIAVRSLTNHLSFKQATTEIQYRDGFEHEAKQLKKRLGGSVAVARSDTLRSHIDVRVLLGHDITPRISEIEGGLPAQVATSN